MFQERLHGQMNFGNNVCDQPSWKFMIKVISLLDTLMHPCLTKIFNFVCNIYNLF